MTDKDLKELLASGKQTAFTIDPLHKTEIQRQTVTAITSAIQKALTQKKTVKVVVSA